MTLRNLSGRLTFHDLGPISSIEVFLSHGYICGIYASSVCLTDEALILEKLVAITATQRGRFNFEPLPPEMVNQGVRLSIDAVNLAVVTVADEIAWRRSEFVLPAKMVILDQDDCEILEPMLMSVYARSHHLFETGIDAQQLAIQLQVSLVQAQFYIFKLIEAGAVKIGMPASARVGRPSPILLQSSRFEVVTTRRLRLQDS